MAGLPWVGVAWVSRHAPSSSDEPDRGIPRAVALAQSRLPFRPASPR